MGILKLYITYITRPNQSAMGSFGLTYGLGFNRDVLIAFFFAYF